ncbi:DUF1826 domain-containing protein [Pseudomonas stutzeri]|uniref:DUF1826 domain-containing protein n=1 Tax=Stutzerimonas stutzeri TaxID=316 RepID=A0A2N8S4T0_STUST|nr:DUF1826 domain-containing protein [Stutzerimonas stutzeri]MCQ4293966.1 DUF1826 domain-containing protein [Stutzerimonas stutzeri]PNF81633.1 DUF1826 domain-containing protein [Stutzerimonas stutzeri]
MLAQQTIRPQPRQLLGGTPAVLGEALNDGINLAVWQRQLPLHIAGFAEALLALGEPLTESLTLEPVGEDEVQLPTLAAAYRDLSGHAGFVADVAWLVRAFACLVDARRIGLRLRVLGKPMCPRFHVDHVPLRLITTYAGAGSEWLREGAMSRRRLGDPTAEPADPNAIEQLGAGDVALFKGEKWLGNEGAGIIHRSPQATTAERRLILTLDWLA